MTQLEKSAPQQIDEIIQQYGGWKGEVLAQIRTVIHAADPEVVEEILSGANSEYKVHIQAEPIQSSSDLPTPYGWRSVRANLQFRVPEEADNQIDLLEDNKRMQQAWKDFYDVSSQNLPSVVQKSLDSLAGVIRDRFYPEEGKTNLSDYAKRIEQNIDTLDLPSKDRVDWPALMKSMAGYVDKRGVHNSGTDSDPEFEDAHTVLHICIALIVILKENME